jgi:hypothetical protein
LAAVRLFVNSGDLRCSLSSNSPIAKCLELPIFPKKLRAAVEWHSFGFKVGDPIDLSR